MDDLELAYVHDGSLEGLLTAVFLAFERKEYPSDVSASCRFMPRLGQRIVEVETNMERGVACACGNYSRMRHGDISMRGCRLAFR
mgnify:CR=1 FL=1